MKKEVINDHLMRVILTMEDLESHGLSMMDLMSHSKAIDDFFHKVLREVDTDNQFANTDTLTFQILPSQKEIDLFISKPTDDPEASKDEITDIIKSTFFDRQNDDDAPDAGRAISFDGTFDDLDSIDDDSMSDDSVDFGDVHLENTIRVFKFKNIDNLISMTKFITINLMPNDLYTYDKAFYWVVKPDSLRSRLDLDQKTPMIYEYADKSKYPSDFLEEHGNLLVPDHAQLEIKKYFK
ncbi:MAG: adaptor protein MecA [Limosilactobacillus sp.]|uniref:adaptor protein MecA n=1 Tax=Limosilactobacillus sp. TaxID=2773925 RepID=UPI002706482D|nr:adaptor protein MecA [Limosilactobacillus sp.]